ncbi:MAG: phage tail tube protein [Patescibacteria group bacterium]
MAKFTGARIDLGVGKESVRGTGVAPTYWLRPSEVSVDEKVMRSMDESTRNLIEDSVDSQVVGKLADGEFTLPIRDSSIGLLLLNIFGTDTPAAKSAPKATLYVHSVTVAQSNQHAEITMLLKEANADKDYALSMLTGMELSIELGKHATAKFGFRSKTGAVQARTATYTAENIFLPNHGVVKFASALSGLTAASGIKVRSVNLKIDKKIEDDRALGSVDPEDILNTTFSVTGEIELVYDATTYVTSLLANTAQALRIDLQNTAVTIGTSANPGLQINLAKVLLEEVSRGFGKGDIVTQTLSFKAFYSDTDSSMIGAVLTNLVASY